MGFVEDNGGLGITVECGQHRQASGLGAKVAYASAVALLRNLDMLAPTPCTTPPPTRRTLLVHRGLIRHPASLQYAPWFKSDAKVPYGSQLAQDKTGVYLAPTRDELVAKFELSELPECLHAIMVTRPSRLARVKPHDAFLLGLLSVAE
jgi:hypothetical protein